MNIRLYSILLICLLLALPLAAQISIDPPTRTFAKEGGGGAILTSGTGTWSATTSASWLTITPRTSGNAGESCIYVVNANLTADTRQAEISINDQTHTVTQTGYAATLDPLGATADLDGSSGVIAVSTQAGISWTAVSNTPWITVTPGSGGSNGSVDYTVAPYSGVVSRTGSLTIAGRTFSVTQTGEAVSLSPKVIDKPYSSDIIQVQVAALATTVWSITSNSSWISVIDGGNGFGDSNVTLAVNTNPSFAERIGTVSIGSATLTVTQKGTPTPVLDLLPREATADPVGAFGNVAVVATPDAPWTAESLNPWLIISDGSSGAGNGNIEYVVSANPALTPREGRIRVTPPVYVPTVDLTKQLWAYIPEEGGTRDKSGWIRNLSGPLDSFDGSSAAQLSGPSLFREGDDSLSVAVQFQINNTDAINRLFQIQRTSSSDDQTAVYTSAQNKITLYIGSQIFESDFVVEPGIWHQLVLTATQSHQTRVYVAPVGSPEIGLIGDHSVGVAPFPADYVTSGSRFKFGYSDKPNSGYLSNGAMKELRIYGRTLTEEEVAALHETSISNLPFGSSPVDRSLVPVAKMNLRGQALVISEDGQIFPSVGLGWTGTEVTESWSKIRTSYTGNQLIPSITGFSASSAYGRLSWRCEFNYSDGTTESASAHSSTLENPTSYIDVNPNPSKPVGSISVFAVNLSGGTQVHGRFTGLGDVYPERTLSNWLRGPDRFGLEQRALVSSTGSGSLSLRHFRDYFSQDSASYNIWIRPDSLSGTAILFSRPGITLELDSTGNLIYKSGSTVVAGFPALIEVGKWHMITLVGNSEASNVTLYVDGNEVGNTPVPSLRIFGGATQVISGTDKSSDMTVGFGFIGTVDEVSFYDGILAASEVQTIYQREAPQSIYHTVTQGVVDPAVSPQLIEMPSSGGSALVDLVIAQNVNWTVSPSDDWITVTSPATGAGSDTVAFDVAANPTVYERQAEVDVAGKTVTVVQAGLNASVTHDDLIFGTDGGSGWIEVLPEGNGVWQSVSDVSWITVAIGESGAGAGSVFIVADPFTNTSSSRTGSVTVAGQKVYVTQQGYSLSIDPQVAQIGSNAGAGEFGVAAPLSAVWEGISTQPWITIIGSTSGIGNGALRYEVAANDTGTTRTGRIIVSGQEYTITQVTNLLLSTEANGDGAVSGAGSYNTDAVAVLTATPGDGNVFSHWSGDAVGSSNPLNLSMDSSKSVIAHFIPETAADSLSAAAVQAVVDDPNSLGLYTADQMHELALGDPVLRKEPATGKMTLRLAMQRSSDLNIWAPFLVIPENVGVTEGALSVEIAPEEKAAFYRVKTNAE